MIAKEFLKELSVLCAKYGADNIELVIGFAEQWKKAFEIFTNQDKNCYEILADELDDIKIPIEHFIDIIKFYNKNNFSYEKEIKVRYKEKYYTITELYIDIDNCVVVKIVE